MSRYAERITFTEEHFAQVLAGVKEGKTFLEIHPTMGITYGQIQTCVYKMRRLGLLPPGRKRMLVPGEKGPKRKPPNARGQSAQSQAFYKWESNKATPPINGPLIAKIGKEPAGPNAKGFLENNGCMWPVAGNLYCGEPKDGGRQPYCAEHRKRGTQAYRPMKKPVDGNGTRLLKSLNE